MINLDTLGREPGPSFDEPLAMLLACHDKIRRFCDQLEALPGHIASRGVDEAVQGSIDGVMRYFDQAGPQHHSDEEEELFPILLERVPEAAPRLERLASEHGYLQSCWNEIRDDLLALKKGELEAVNPTEIGEFVRMYREHAEIEEQWLIPTAERTLSADEQRAAGERMAARRQG
ncbi:hemerythrin domain-containing protein [Crenobacter sp. SG2305]|uniref:hemerythrin domain-containing protein n=1 Tax=Crenobacter oryzisoli TaxID=3056844 RepID=UPI0025AAC3B1|nr:hemerythrin domain-containing protein [Crenobacter sp. SG2305]MDN0083879.1 hemerythrin domain-containing protein [Crenobacter sp. SG2305]